MRTNRYNDSNPIETLKQYYELVELAKRMGVLNKLKLPANPDKIPTSRLERVNIRLKNTLRAVAETRIKKATEDAKR